MSTRKVTEVDKGVGGVALHAGAALAKHDEADGFDPTARASP